MNPRPACSNVLDLIGDTPMVQLNKFDTGRCQLFLKMEALNPGGSIKDRIALSMIEAAEQDGRLRPGGTLVEATAGNTGLGLALVAAQKGYRLIIVIPDKMSQEKIFHLQAMGAEVVLTRSDVGKGHADYYQDKAERIAAQLDNALFVNQFGNEANPLAGTDQIRGIFLTVGRTFPARSKPIRNSRNGAVRGITRVWSVQRG